MIEYNDILCNVMYVSREAASIVKVASGAIEPLPEGPRTKPLVLSVDDDEVNQEVVKNALSDEHEVAIAMDGQEALDFVARRKQQGKATIILILYNL